MTENEENGRPLVAVPGRMVMWIGLVMALLAAYDLQAFLPANVLGLPGQSVVDAGFRAALPQGWAFFTKSPRSMDIVAYAVDRDGNVRIAMLGAYADPANTFGLDRGARAQGAELALLISQVPTSAWRPCERPAAECLTGAAGAGALQNDSRARTMCGPIVLAQQTPVPWAYRDLVSDRMRVTDVARVVVSC